VDDNGFTSVDSKTDLGIVKRLNRDLVRTAKNDSGGTVTRGQVVYWYSGTADGPNFRLAKADATNTMPLSES